MLLWTPDAFWRSTVWEVMLAYDGYALANGLTKKDNPDLYPTEEERTALRARLERERLERQKHDHAGRTGT